LNESNIWGRAKADLYLIEREINSLCISKDTKQSEIDELVENFKSKMNKIMKKLLKLVDSTSNYNDKLQIKTLTDKVQSIQDHLNIISNKWDLIICYKERRLQYMRDKRVDKSNSRSKSPLSSKNKKYNLSANLSTTSLKVNNTPQTTNRFGANRKYNNSAYRSLNMKNQSDSKNNSFSKNVSNKRSNSPYNKNDINSNRNDNDQTIDKSIRYQYKSPNKSNNRLNISNLSNNENSNQKTEIPNFLSVSGTRKDELFDQPSNGKSSIHELTQHNMENADDSMQEIQMIGKIKELTESTSRLDLKSTPLYNIENKLKSIKKMMNTLCAK